MIKYTKVKVLKITDQQHQTLEKLRNRKVNVADFIRVAIAEKIQRDAKELIVKPKKEYCPF
jgi:post-segregation antitoxin (ccd killing protein)